jgi:hypothetical protein
VRDKKKGTIKNLPEGILPTFECLTNQLLYEQQYITVASVPDIRKKGKAASLQCPVVRVPGIRKEGKAVAIRGDNIEVGEGEK